MAFCKNCGQQLADNAAFCAACGTPTNAGDSQNTQNTQQTSQNFAQQYQAPVQPDDDAADVQNNKAMGILSYIGILVLIPLFAAKNSKFAQYHARQGVTLAVLEIAYSIVNIIITAILGAIFPLRYTLIGGVTHGAVYGIITGILGLCSIFFLVLAIIGIINAAQGQKKELPIIGKIDIVGMFTKK